MLQLLEYGITAIITPMKRFHNYLRGRITGSKQEGQVGPQKKDDIQTDPRWRGTRVPVPVLIMVTYLIIDF